jgi:hypothetical protein
MSKPSVSLTPQQPLTTIDRWRAMALDFHAVQWCLSQGSLQPDFEPADLARLRRQPASKAEKAVFAFLLHIYNSSNRFDLAEISRWDEDHIKAFGRWVSGALTGRPCHYF